MSITVQPWANSHVPASVRDVKELKDDLKDEAPSLSPFDEPREGDKGIPHEIVVDPVGVTAILGAVRAFAKWLDRDRRRSLTFSRVDSNGKKTETTISGENISLDTLEEALRELNDPDDDPPAGTSA